MICSSSGTVDHTGKDITKIIKDIKMCRAVCLNSVSDQSYNRADEAG